MLHKNDFVDQWTLLILKYMLSFEKLPIADMNRFAKPNLHNNQNVCQLPDNMSRKIVFNDGAESGLFMLRIDSLNKQNKE